MGLHDRIKGENGAGESSEEQQPIAALAANAAIGEAPKSETPGTPTPS